MKLSTLIEAVIEGVGLGAARDAKLLVARLPEGALTVAASEDTIGRALGRAKRERVPLDGTGAASAALSLDLPEGDEGLQRVEQLASSTRDGGLVLVSESQPLGRSTERARTAGLFLRAGLVELRQVGDGSIIYTSGRVRRRGSAR